jgi:hypothetical protein
METLRRGAAASIRFAWDFLVGDTPEVIVTTGVMVALAFALHTERMAVVITLPLVGLGGLGIGVWRGSGRKERPQCLTVSSPN